MSQAKTFFFLIVSLVLSLAVGAGGYWLYTAIPNRSPSRVVDNIPVAPPVISEGDLVFDVSPQDEQHESGGAVFYAGSVRALTLVSRESAAVGTEELVFSWNVNGTENRFRVRMAYDWPDSGAWTDHDWLMNYDVEWPQVGETIEVFLLGVKNYTVAQADVGNNWPKEYQQVYGKLEQGKRRDIEEYFNSGVASQGWVKDDAGVVDLRNIAAVRRIVARD